MGKTSYKCKAMDLGLKKLAFVVTEGKNDNKPIDFNPLSLQQKGAIPHDLILQPKKSMMIPNMFDLKFGQGIRIISHPSRLIFEENFDDSSEVKIKDIALKCLPKGEYTRIDIHLSSQIDSKKDFKKFISKKLGGWMKHGTANPNVEIEFSYDMKGKLMKLNIKFIQNKAAQGGKFDLSAEIHYKVSKKDSYNRVKDIIENYEQDVDVYKDIIEKNIVKGLQA